MVSTPVAVASLLWYAFGMTYLADCIYTEDCSFIIVE